MKIGLLTFHFSNNYGALLQAYALSTCLTRLGHDVHLINLRPAPVGAGFHLRQLAYRNWLYFAEKMLPGSDDSFRRFEKTFLPAATPLAYNSAELKALNLDCEAYIVGSDQVWRPRFTKENAESYFLDFVPPGAKKIAYAASFGLDFWEGQADQAERMAEWLRQFDAVSVREASGVEICRNTFGVEARHVLDPTLLVSPDVYQQFIEKDDSAAPPTLFYFKLDRDADSQAGMEWLRTECGLSAVCMGEKAWTGLGIKCTRGYDTVPQWLTQLSRARLVVTDSFHAVCFSLIFRRNFICFINSRRGQTRLVSLLEPLGLQDRMYSSAEELRTRRDWMKPIDFDQVARLMDPQQASSMQFLQSSLEQGPS